MQVYDEGITSTSVSVDDSGAVALPATSRAHRVGMLIQNLGPNSVWLGGSDVAANSGIEVTSGSHWNDDHIGPNCVVYGICASGETADVRVMELS